MWKYCGIDEHSFRDSDQKQENKTCRLNWALTTLHPLEKHLFISSVEKQALRFKTSVQAQTVYLLDGAYHAVYPTDPINGQKAAGPNPIPKQKHSSILPPLLCFFILWSEWRCHQTRPVKIKTWREKKCVFFISFSLATFFLCRFACIHLLWGYKALLPWKC